MTNPIEITLPVKDFNITTNRLDSWITEAIRASNDPKKELSIDIISLSRNRVKKLIESSQIKVNNVIILDPSFKIKPNYIIKINLPIAIEALPIPQNINLDILYEDQFLLILNKKAGMVVHPAPGHPNKTLVNALLYHCGNSLQGIGGVKRPGIVHRLDKNTSGVMVVAKTELCHIKLCKIFSNHDLDRRYNAVVWGQPATEGVINKPIGRSTINRKKMTISNKGKMAITKWKILDIYLPFATLIECKLETGRTHQIRVHLSDLGHSIVGDTTYGKSLSKKKIKNCFNKEKLELIKQFDRQALHAVKLSFDHPITNKLLNVVSPLPIDIKELISILK
jgi:23S rRNA pseudouridine1911/1915/1917 synthase